MARSSAKTTVKVGGQTVQVSSLDKVMYPDAGFTKGDVIEYYSRIWPVMQKHIKDRPVALKRYPDGVEGKSFFQKNCPVHRPEWMPVAKVARKSGRSDPIEYCLINNMASIVFIANLGGLELHTHLNKASNFDKPTMMMFDLDPGRGMSLLDCLRVGQELRDALSYFKLKSFAKVSGSKGLHVAAPLNTAVDFDATKSFARSLAEVLERQDSKNITTNMSKARRVGKVFIDWSQNDAHKTTICAYSLRAKSRPTVSAPVSWDEVDRAVKRRDISGLSFEAHDVLERVEEVGDLFEPVVKLKQRLPSETVRR